MYGEWWSSKILAVGEGEGERTPEQNGFTQEKLFTALLKTIEDGSKHARNVLFVLIVSSLYVVITAFQVARRRARPRFP